MSVKNLKKSLNLGFDILGASIMHSVSKNDDQKTDYKNK